MMKNKVACLIVDDEPMAREILENHLARIGEMELLASCRNAMEAFRVINTQAVDLVFLDINMPEISGLSFARSVTRDIKVIFTTAYREYAVDGFDLKAVDYLLKPISFERLLQGVNKYLEERSVHMQSPQNEIQVEKEDAIFVRADRKMVKVVFGDMVFIESVGDYLKIHMDDGPTLVIRETLSNLEARLPQDLFLRCHRSFVVSLHKIGSYTSETIGIGKREIPISRSYREQVMKKLGA